MDPTHDIREDVFRGTMDSRVTGSLFAEAEGVLSGIERARKRMESLGLIFSSNLKDGSSLDVGQEIACVIGNPVQLAMAEEQIIGALSKSSGIATASQRARLGVKSHCRVVSGGWKKMPLEMKELIRQAARDGGIDVRISEVPFIYLDKNYVRIIGDVRKAVQNTGSLGRKIVIQVRGDTGPVELEAIEAAEAGADIVMVDTGRRSQLAKVSQALRNKGLRSRVRLAFAGSISLERLEELTKMDLDIIDIGYAIVDAPCLPMRFDVTRVE
jgi:nicotinate-nucleotide pyrophosphorylase (carboxylating)